MISRWRARLLQHRAAATWIAAVLAVGGVIWVAVLWWPAGRAPDRWLDRGDQLASIISVVLTAVGVVLAYLVWRSGQPNASGSETEMLAASQVQATGPTQLPRDATWFTGRRVELQQLLAIGPDPEQGTTVMVCAVDGMAGIGKTALTVHAAHRMVERYPDGQLFIDLHGFTDAVLPVEPSAALERLLRRLGVPGEQVPVELDDRAALWRSVVAGRRMLLVLDNAASEEQVAPLLPGVPGCLVLVTSRRRLAGLEATRTLSLDTLPIADAITLFVRTACQGQRTVEPRELVREIVERCGHLPLAIRIAAAWLAAHPTWKAADLAARLRAQQERLAELKTGPRSVAAALELSYRRLTGEQQRTYQLLGLHPGPDIDLYAAAALAGGTLTQVSRMLDQLLYAHLLQGPVPGRYQFHDLVRVHAAQVATTAEASQDRRAAMGRLFDHYRHTASVAMDAAYPYERERRPCVPVAASATPELLDPTEATDWLDTELPNLLAVARHAVDNGWPEHTLHLSAVLHRHLRTRGHYQDAEALHTHALVAADGAGDRSAKGYPLRGLGHVEWLQGRYDQAAKHYEHAVEIARATGHLAGELDALTGLGQVRRRQARYEQAIDHYQQALEVAQRIVHRPGQQEALRGLGDVHRRQGQYQQAVDHYQEALEIARATGHLAGELDALTGLGHVRRLQGRRRQALNHYQEALEAARTAGDRTAELNALIGLGHLRRLQGQNKRASSLYQEALDIARVTGLRPGELNALIGLGHVANALGQPNAALTHHGKALELATNLQQPADQARVHNGLAYAHRALRQTARARHHWETTLDILTSLGVEHTDDEHASVSRIYLQLLKLDQQE